MFELRRSYDAPQVPDVICAHYSLQIIIIEWV